MPVLAITNQRSLGTVAGITLTASLAPILIPYFALRHLTWSFTRILSDDPAKPKRFRRGRRCGPPPGCYHPFGRGSLKVGQFFMPTSTSRQNAKRKCMAVSRRACNRAQVSVLMGTPSMTLGRYGCQVSVSTTQWLTDAVALSRSATRFVLCEI